MGSINDRECVCASRGDPGAQTIEVELGDLYIEPSTILVDANTDLTLDIQNAGVLPHDLDIEGVAATPILDGGDSYELHVGVLDPGEYGFICTVPGHASTMNGTIVVAEPGEEHDEHADGLSWEEMDRLHMEGVASFPAETEGQGNVLMEPEMDGDVKVYELTASAFDWEVEPGVWRQAMGYNEMVPGPQIHPMHLHGIPRQVVACDGYPLPQPYMVDTVTVAPGERIDVIVDATEPGPWAFHCHVLSHAEGPQGMFGMVTVFFVDDEE